MGRESHNMEGAEVSHIFSASNRVTSVANMKHFVTDGAWDSSTSKGVAAWVKNSGHDAEEAQQVMKFNASSSILVEAKSSDHARHY